MWLLPLLLYFTFFASISWGKLLHPIFDTGSEIEIAARLSEGQHLYNELKTYYSPLSYYINALLLSIFGHHLEVFYTIGLVLSLIIILLAYWLVKRLTNFSWAILCSVYLITYCVFNPGGLFNLVTPYSYGTVYATALCLTAFVTLDRYKQTDQIVWLLITAIASGLAGAAKQEYGVAALVATTVAINLCSTDGLKARIKHSLLVILVSIGCALFPLVLLAQYASWGEIYTSLVPTAKAHALINSGLFYFSPARTINLWFGTFKVFILTLLAIYIFLMTSQQTLVYVIRSKQKLNGLAIVLVSIFSVWISLSLLHVPFSSSASKIVLVTSSLIAGLGVAIRWLIKQRWMSNKQWMENLIQCLMSISCAGLSWYLWRWVAIGLTPFGNLTWLLPFLAGWFALTWKSLLQHQHAALLWSLLTFSGVLYSRFWFNIDFYGIYAVAAILLFFTFLYQITQRIKLPIWTCILIGLLMGNVTNLIEFTQYRYPISSAQGTMYTNQLELARTYNQTIQYINQSGAKSVLTIPGGAILNFLTATHAPSSETFFLPGVLPDPEAEREFLTRMQRHLPDLIIYVDVPFAWLNQGYQTLAQFNPLVNQWITHQYRVVYLSSTLIYDNREWTLRIYSDRP